MKELIINNNGEFIIRFASGGSSRSKPLAELKDEFRSIEHILESVDRISVSGDKTVEEIHAQLLKHVPLHG